MIDGDYYSGLQSLKNALCEFVEYLSQINYSANKPKSSASFEGSFEDFKRFIGPACRNQVNIFCKGERESHKSICEFCDKSAELQSAHIIDRPIIIKDILDKNFKDKTNPNLYKVNLEDFFERFKNAHLPINQHIFFLCKTCHNAFDKPQGGISEQDIRNKRGY